MPNTRVHGLAAGGMVASLRGRRRLPWPGGRQRGGRPPDALDALRNEYRGYDWPADKIEEFILTLDRNGLATAYLFRCLSCGVHLAYADFA